MQVLLVGGGVFSASAAHALLDAGHRVRILAPGPLPHPRAASTDRSKCVRMDYGSDALLTELGAQAIVRWRRWNARFESPLFHEVGFQLLSRTALRPGTFEGDSWDLQTAQGVPLERGIPPAAAELGWVDGYLNPQAGWVNSGEVLRQLLIQARDRGAELIEGTATRVEDGVVQTAEGSLGADAVVVAAGAWTPEILQPASTLLRPSGQCVVLFDHASGPTGPVWAGDISQTGFYGFPVGDDGVAKVGHHGIGVPGPTRDLLHVPDGTIERFRGFLADLYPQLAQAPVADTRLCLYCDSTDGDFVIDRVPGHTKTWVAAGGSGHGFKFAPLIGDWVVRALGGGPLPRFAWRDARPGWEQARSQT